MSVRVNCNMCYQTAIIHSSSTESPELKKLYCVCTNPDCGHTFMAHFEFSHTISPANSTIPASVLAKLKGMNKRQQIELFSNLS